MEDILGQDEIDALLKGVGGGDIETENDDEVDPSIARAFDFNNQERIVRGRLPALDIINERFSRAFQRQLNELIMSSVEVVASEVKIIKMVEYQRHLFFPTSLNVMKFSPLNGAALFTLDSKLVFTAVDIYYGGTGLLPFKIEGREYTPVESRMIKTIVDIAVDILTDVWSAVMAVDIESIHQEMNPKFAAIVDPTEMVVVNPINIRFEGVEGRFDIVMPYSMLEPIRDKLEESLQALQGEGNSRWSATLEEEAKNIVVNAKVELTKIRMNMEDVVRMDVGDVIPIRMPEKMVVQIEGIGMMKGDLVTQDDQKSIKVTEMLQHPAYKYSDKKHNIKEWQ